MWALLLAVPHGRQRSLGSTGSEAANLGMEQTRRVEAAGGGDPCSGGCCLRKNIHGCSCLEGRQRPECEQRKGGGTGRWRKEKTGAELICWCRCSRQIEAAGELRLEEALDGDEVLRKGRSAWPQAPGC